jgi:translation initiation factor RLI1
VEVFPEGIDHLGALAVTGGVLVEEVDLAPCGAEVVEQCGHTRDGTAAIEVDTEDVVASAREGACAGCPEA